MQGEENGKPNNDTDERNEKYNHIIKKGKVEENEETGTGRSQVRVTSILNIKFISESTVVIEWKLILSFYPIFLTFFVSENL